MGIGTSDRDGGVFKVEKSRGYFDHGRTKNQKAAANTYAVDIAEKEQDLRDNTSCLELTNNHLNGISEGIGCVLQGYANEMLEKNDTNQAPPGDEIKSMPGTLKLQVRILEVPTKEREPVGDKEYKQEAEKHLKLLEQVNDNIPRKQKKPKERHPLKQEPGMKKQKPVSDFLKTSVDQNKGAYKPRKARREGRPWTLSSLFK